MSYRCSICQVPSGPRHPRLVHVTYHRNGNVAREHPVCRTCKRDLDDGTSYADLLAVRGRRREGKDVVETVVTVEVLPPEAESFGRPAKTTTL